METRAALRTHTRARLMFSIVGAARRRRYVINHGRRRIVETDAAAGRATNWKNCMKTFRPLGWRSLRGSGNSPTDWEWVVGSPTNPSR